VTFPSPPCARYGCPNHIPRERWLWGQHSAATCSRECADAVRLEATVKEVAEIRRCARDGCHNEVGHKDRRYCSNSCAMRARVGEALGPTLYIPPPPPEDEVLKPGQCARPGCTNQTKKGGAKYCSRQCANAMNAGDRWERVAPKMEYTEAVRHRMVREIYWSEVNRRYAS
jgi:hypothetical protein